MRHKEYFITVKQHNAFILSLIENTITHRHKNIFYQAYGKVWTWLIIERARLNECAKGYLIHHNFAKIEKDFLLDESFQLVSEKMICFWFMSKHLMCCLTEQ